MRTRLSRAAALAAVTALFTLGLAAAPASAATETPTDHPGLVAAFANSGTDRVEVGADIDVTDEVLTVDHDLTLDLKGWDVTTFNITIIPSVTLIIIDSSITQDGSLTATPLLPFGRAGITVKGSLQIGTSTVYGGAIRGTGNCTIAPQYCGAGIGGNFGEPSGAITINSGDVDGYGGGQTSGDEGGSGIGDGYNPSSAGGPITINGGTVVADGGSSSPGLSSREGGGLVTITGGLVLAIGGEYSAGIGGSTEQNAGTIDIDGGTVTATGGTYAAGIGGGGGLFGGSGGIISIDGAAVTANAGASNGAGIGGGWGGFSSYSNYGAVVSIGAGSVVTTSSIRAVGPANGTTSQVGLLTITGELVISSGGSLDIPAGATAKVSPGGIVRGAGSVGGAGSITNNGSIQNATVTTATVTDHNYLVTFSGNAPSATPATQTVRVYATSMVNGARLIPPAPSNPAGTFTNWATTSAGGTTFTPTTTLSASTTVYAIYTPVHIVVSPATTNGVSGQSAAFTVEGFDSNNVSLGDYTSLVTFSTSNPGDDIVTGNSVEFGPAGSTTVTATLDSDPAITASATAAVAHGQVAGIVFTLSSLSVAQGGSITYVVEARDAYGNTWPAGSIVTSDVSTDVITATTISFPHASPHVITANIPGFSTSATVTVVPYGLALTGFVYDTALPIYALGTGLVGILLLLAARRRERAAA